MDPLEESLDKGDIQRSSPNRFLLDWTSIVTNMDVVEDNEDFQQLLPSQSAYLIGLSNQAHKLDKTSLRNYDKKKLTMQSAVSNAAAHKLQLGCWQLLLS